MISVSLKFKLRIGAAPQGASLAFVIVEVTASLMGAILIPKHKLTIRHKREERGKRKKGNEQ